MDDFTKHDPNDADLARRLDVFAEIELSPSVAGTTAMRMAVMNAAHRRAALLQADRTLEEQATWATRKPVPEVVGPAAILLGELAPPDGSGPRRMPDARDPRGNGVVGPARWARCTRPGCGQRWPTCRAT